MSDLESCDQALRVSALQRAAGYFKVARTMPVAYDVGRGFDRLAPALAILDEAEFRQVETDSLRGAVQSLRRRLARAYGRKDMLSAATKFLWLMHRPVVVILDSQARAALGTPDGDYDSYLDHWYEGFASNVSKVREAFAALAEGNIDLSLQSVSRVLSLRLRSNRTGS